MTIVVSVIRQHIQNALKHIVIKTQLALDDLTTRGRDYYRPHSLLDGHLEAVIRQGPDKLPHVIVQLLRNKRKVGVVLEQVGLETPLRVLKVSQE